MDDDVGSRGTIALWYRSDAAWIGGPDRALFDAARTNKYFDAMVDSASRVTFNLEDSVDADVQFRTSARAFTADTWVHLAWTWDLPANSYQIYINGTLAASSPSVPTTRLASSIRSTLATIVRPTIRWARPVRPPEQSTKCASTTAS